MSGIANWQAQIRIDIEDLKKRIKVAEGEINNFTNEDRKVKLDIDTKTLESAIQKLDKMLDSLGKGTGDFKQFENLSKELSSIVSEVQSLSKAFGKVDDSGAKTLLSSIQNIDKSLSELSQNILNVNKNMSNIGGNTSGAVKQAENISNAYQDAAKEAEKLADAQSKIGQKSNISSGLDSNISKYQEIVSLVKEYYELSQKIKTPKLSYQKRSEDYDRIDGYLLKKAPQKVGTTDIEKDINDRYHKMAKGVNEGSEFAIKAMRSAIQRYWSDVTEMPSDEKLLSSRKVIPYGNKGQKEEYIIPKKYQDMEKSVIQETIAMNKNNIAYEEERKQIEANNSALKERMDLIRNTIKSYDKNPDYNGEYKMGLSLKSSDKGKTDIFSSASSMSQEEMLQEICNMLGVEIPKNADKAKEAINEVATATTEPKKDAFPKTPENLEQVAQSEQKVQQEAVATDKALDNIGFTPNTEGFDDIIAKFGILREQAEQITKIVKTTKQTADGMPDISYKATLRNGSSYYLGENSTPQVLNASETVYDAKADNAKRLEREKQIWNELTTSLDRYAALQKRIASNNALSTDNKEAAKLLKYIYELQRSDVLPSEKLNASNEKLQQIKQTVTDLKAKLKESTLDSLQGSIDKYHKIYEQRRTYSSDFTPSEQYVENLNELNTAIGKLEKYKNTLKDVGEVTVEQEAELKRLVAACEKASDSFKSLSASEKGASQIAVDKLVQRINKDLDECTNYSENAKHKLRALREELESANPRNLKEITSEIINIENAEIRAGRAGRTLWDTMKNSGFHQIAAQMAGMVGVYDVINAGKEGLSVVRELNTALTEMQKVSDETKQKLKDYQSTTFNTADAVGTTAKQIQNSTADWMRLGESMNQAAASAKDANILLNVSEFNNIDEATESLVSMSQAYKDLDKMDIIDVLNNVGNNYSISTDGLATALQDSASALVTANNDLNEAVALTTAGNAIPQDPSSVGAGMRTISLRLVGTKAAKEELESLGEDTSDVITTTSKLRETILDATKAASADGKGFDILDDNGNYKSTYEIMQGLADLYDDIVKKDKELGTNNLNLLLETIAGKNRSNIAASILQNGDMLRSVYEDAQNSDGSAEKELNSYLDSVDGKMQQLQNRAQEFWANTIDDEKLKSGISALTTIVELATNLETVYTKISSAIGGGSSIGGTLGMLFGAVQSFSGRGKIVLCPSF